MRSQPKQPNLGDDLEPFVMCILCAPVVAIIVAFVVGVVGVVLEIWNFIFG